MYVQCLEHIIPNLDSSMPVPNIRNSCLTCKQERNIQAEEVAANYPHRLSVSISFLF